MTSFRSFLDDDVLRLRRKESFLRTLKPDSRILDVGCGNDSPLRTKSILPGCHYTGIDVADYNQRAKNVADIYVTCSSASFAQSIADLGARFDAVLSAHNLEHCEQRDSVLDAMLSSLVPGGRIYLSFPSQASVNFPSRRGTLNYFDDPTHRDLPPDYDQVVRAVQERRFKVVFATPRYRPLYKWIFGALNERSSRLQGRNRWGTWEFYGFESIIWAQKESDLPPATGV